jgi:hypothetical protein
MGYSFFGFKTKLDSASRFPPRKAWTSCSKAFSFQSREALKASRP